MQACESLRIPVIIIIFFIIVCDSILEKDLMVQFCTFLYSVSYVKDEKHLLIFSIFLA